MTQTISSQQMMKSREQYERALALAAKALSVCALGAAMAACTNQIDAAQAQDINGLIYKLHEKEPFSGKVTNIDSRRVPGVLGGGLCTSEFKNGKFHGRTECVAPNGEKHAEVNWKNGQRDGLERFWESSTGKLYLSGEWRAGRKHGTHEGYNPHTGALVQSSEWEDNTIKSKKVWNITGEHLLVDLKWNGDKHSGFVKEKQIERNYLDGLRHGPERFYDLPPGTPYSVNQKLNAEGGQVLRLGVGGFFYGVVPEAVVIEETLWDRDQPVRTVKHQMPKTSAAPAKPLDAADVDACVEKWTAAHRKEVGEDAPIRMDLINEWEGWCKQGKLPG